jgi:hypothetical protein
MGTQSERKYARWLLAPTSLRKSHNNTKQVNYYDSKVQHLMILMTPCFKYCNKLCIRTLSVSALQLTFPARRPPSVG